MFVHAVDGGWCVWWYNSVRCRFPDGPELVARGGFPDENGVVVPLTDDDMGDVCTVTAHSAAPLERSD